jgi:multiple sugar transport system substrate-binding protein
MRVVRVAVITLMLATALGVLAFGPRGGRGIPTDRKVVVIDYWEKWTGNEGQQMAQIVDEFNNTVGRDKGIFVRDVSTSNIETKALVSIAAGVPPDVAGMWDRNLVQMAALGALTPLDDLAARHGITAATYKKVYWDSLHWDGHLYGLISTPATIALVYNRRIFHESAKELLAAGCDPDRAPRTLAEFDRYAAALDVKDASGRLVRAGILPAAMWYLHDMSWWFGGEVWDAQHGRFTLTSPGVVAAYAWAQSYSRRMGPKATADFQTGMGNFDSPQNPFLSGAEVMEQQGPWMANYILHQRPSMFGVAGEAAYDTSRPAAERRAQCDFAVAPFPSAVPGLENVTYAAYDSLVIPKGAKHPAEAFEFIAYVNRQDVMEHLCIMHSKNSPLTTVSDYFYEHSKDPYIRVWDDLARSPNAHAVPQVPIWPELMDELTAIGQRLLLSPDQPPLPVLAAAQDRLQQKYDAFAAHQRARRAMQ